MKENDSYLQRLRMIKMGLLAKESSRKPRKPINKKSDKKIEIEKSLRLSDDVKLDKWYEDRRKEMTGRCALCGGKTEKLNDKTYRRSIHHLLDKRKSMFPSLKTHPLNFLEVCFYGNSCHSNIHNEGINLETFRESKAWKDIKERLKILLVACSDEDKKNKHFSTIVDYIEKWD